MGFGGSGLKFFFCIMVTSEYLFGLCQIIYCLLSCLLPRRRSTYSEVGVLCLKFSLYSIFVCLYIYGRKRLNTTALNSLIHWGMLMLSKALDWHCGQRLQFSREVIFFRRWSNQFQSLSGVLGNFSWSESKCGDPNRKMRAKSLSLILYTGKLVYRTYVW